jgi:hypothetical protein
MNARALRRARERQERQSNAREDEREIAALLAEVYEALSGPPGERDWLRFRRCYASDARMMPSRRTERGIVREIFDLDRYIESRSALLAQTAFYEREVARRTLVFGDIAHAWSVYEARFALDGPVALRGVNSVQLHRGDSGWRIVSVLWDNERSGGPGGTP